MQCPAAAHLGICKMQKDFLVAFLRKLHKGQRFVEAINILTVRLRAVPAVTVAGCASVRFCKGSRMLAAATLTGAECAALVFQLPLVLGEEADARLLPPAAHTRVLVAGKALCAAYRATYGPEEFTEADLDAMEQHWTVCLMRMKEAFADVDGCNFSRPKVHALSHLRSVFYETHKAEESSPDGNPEFQAQAHFTRSFASADSEFST